MQQEERLRKAGIDEDDMDNEELEISDITREDIFSKCYSRDGNSSNPKITNALEKMKELKKQLQPGARDVGPGDIYSQVLGEDKGGRVRMYGYGVTAKDVYGSNSFGQDDIQRMAMEKEKLEKELEEKNKLIERLLRNEEVRGNITNDPSTSLNSAPAQSARPSAPAQSARPSAPAQSARPSTPSQFVRPSSVNSRPLQVGAKVLLNGISTPAHVAKGTIDSLDPVKLLGNGELLGPEWCEVKIIVAIKYDELLIRKVGGVKNIGQAIGHSIVWPKHLVQLADAR